jgi:PAS domain S-box-containing protein
LFAKAGLLPRRRLMAWAIGIQVAGLLAFTAYIAFDKYRDYRADAETAQAVVLSQRARELVIELQRERAFSAMFLQSGQTRFDAELAARREASDSRRHAFQNFVDSSFREGPPAESADLTAVLARLDALRRDVDTGSRAAREVFDDFTAVIGDISELSIRQPLRVSRRMPMVVAAYNDLVLAHEYLGQLRGFGSIGFVRGQFDFDLLRHFLELHFRYKGLIDAALLHLTEAERQNLYHSVISPEIEETAHRMHQAAIDSFFEQRRLEIDPADWFALQTARVDALSRAVERVAGRIIDLSAAARGRALGIFFVVLFSAIALSLLSVVLVRYSERHARQAGERLVHAIDSIGDAFALWGADDRLVLCNRRYQDIFRRFGLAIQAGVDFEGMVRQLAATGAVSTKGMTAEEWVGHRLREHRRGENVTEYQMPDGCWRLASERKLSSGETVHIHVDVTDIKKRDEELRKLFHAIDQSPIPVFITDPDGRIEYVNPSLVNSTGIERTDILGRTPRVFKSGQNPPEIYADLWRTIKAGGDWRGELCNRRHDGTLGWDQVTISPVLGPDGRPVNFIAIREDVTERRRTEVALREAKEAAEAANRAKTEFLAAMSHELRTPLNAIIGFSEIMASGTLGPIDNPRYREYLKDIGQSGQHLLRMISDILDFAKAEAGRVLLREETLVPEDVVNTSVRMVEEQAAGRRVDLGVTLSPDLPRLRADGTRLRQILVNLLSNAVKFSPEGGRVTVTAAREAEGGIVFSVADAGPGIAPADIPRAFQPFGLIDSSHPRPQQGTGIGLSLSRRFAEMHGGRLEMTSQLGVGTIVALHLPPERTEAAG